MHRSRSFATKPEQSVIVKTAATESCSSHPGKNQDSFQLSTTGGLGLRRHGDDCAQSLRTKS